MQVGTMKKALSFTSATQAAQRTNSAKTFSALSIPTPKFCVFCLQLVASNPKRASRTDEIA